MGIFDEAFVEHHYYSNATENNQCPVYQAGAQQ